MQYSIWLGTLSAVTACFVTIGPFLLAHYALGGTLHSTHFSTALGLLALWAGLEGALVRAKPTLVQDAMPTRLPYLIMVGIALILPSGLLESSLRLQAPTVLYRFGIGLCSTGCAVRVLAIQHLGTGFLDGITIHKQQQLVTTGIYQFLRHPSEVGLHLFLWGYLLVINAWWVLLATLLVLLPLSLYRCWQEDQLLLQHFGDAYLAYRKSGAG